MNVQGSVALVTGANRGLGASLCAALLEHGASRVYAGARNVDSVTMDGVEPIRLDITSPDDIAAAAAKCGDVTLLINNAGIGTATSALAENAPEMAKLEFDTNVLGPLAMCRAFAPILGANGGGAIVNVLSVLAWYSASPTASVLRREGGVVVADQLDPTGTPRSGHPGRRTPRGIYGHRHDRRDRRCRNRRPTTSPPRSWTDSQPVISRCSPTTSVATSEPLCPVT